MSAFAFDQELLKWRCVVSRLSSIKSFPLEAAT
jgi:hypothetical protein